MGGMGGRGMNAGSGAQMAPNTDGTTMQNGPQNTDVTTDQNVSQDADTSTEQDADGATDQNASQGTDAATDQNMPEGAMPSGNTEEAAGSSDSDTANTTTTTTQIQCLAIYGGNIYVNAAGDGLDSNGDLIIYGGNVIVDGPENSGNAALDPGTESGGELIVNGGTVIALGSTGMIEAFSDNSEQNSFIVTIENGYESGDTITIADAEGAVIYEYTAAKSGNAVIFSSEQLTIGENYTVTVNEETQEITLDSVCSGDASSTGSSMGARMGGGMGSRNGGQMGTQQSSGESQSDN